MGEEKGEIVRLVSSGQGGNCGAGGQLRVGDKESHGPSSVVGMGLNGGSFDREEERRGLGVSWAGIREGGQV